MANTNYKKRKLDFVNAMIKKAKPSTVLKKRIRSNLNLTQTGPELKYLDTAINELIPLGSANVDLNVINLIAQGTDNTNRIGNKITVKSIDVNACFTGPASTGAVSPGSCVRWWILVDSQPDGVTATPMEIWDAASLSYLEAHRNLDTSERFRILRTGTCVLGPSNNNSGGANGGLSKHYINIHIALNDAIRYNGSAASITTIQSGAYYFAYCCDIQGATSGPTCESISRVKWIDE